MPNESSASAGAPGGVGELSDQGRNGQTHYTTTEQRPEVSSWKTALDDPLIVFTGLLVIATVGLWVFTALLWRATVKMANDARTSAKDQADRMEASIVEAKESRIAEHRPHIKMRRFSIKESAPDAGGMFVITIEAVNIGRGVAKIKNSHVAVYEGRELPPMMDHWRITGFSWNHPFKSRRQSDHSGMVEDAPVLPGQSIEIDFRFEVTAEQYEAFLAGNLWIVGFITCTDTSDDKRMYHTDFARHMVLGRFRATDDESYESAP